MHQGCTKEAPGRHQGCTKEAPGRHRVTHLTSTWALGHHIKQKRIVYNSRSKICFDLTRSGHKARRISPLRVRQNGDKLQFNRQHRLPRINVLVIFPPTMTDGPVVLRACVCTTDVPGPFRSNWGGGMVKAFGTLRPGNKKK